MVRAGLVPALSLSELEEILVDAPSTLVHNLI